MFLFFPIGVEEASVNRVPVVSIGLAAACVTAFVATWLLPAHPTGVRPGTMQQVVQYWVTHPYLDAPDEFKREFLGAADVEELAALRAEADVPAEEQVRIEQAQLDVLARAALAELEGSSMRRFSLVPSRGAPQPGWLTHMFLHFGWMHLLGNLFFFYLVGPLLEDVWGRVFFALFYVVGGLFAGMAHYLLDPSSHAMMAGASGAIAACIGAFTFRYATRRIRFAYLIWYWVRFWRGTKLVPAWLWGLFWIGSELLDLYATRGKSGVAVMAHVGGFGFGLAFALVLKASGLQARFLEPQVEQTFTWQQHPALQRGLEATERGELAAAAAAFQEVLAQDPENPDAHFGLARAELAQDPAGAHRRLERLFGRLAAKGQGEEVSRMARELGPALEPARVSPAAAFKVASALDADRDFQQLAEPFFVQAGAAAGLLGAKAWLRAAQLCLDAGGSPGEVKARVARARSVPELPPSLQARAAELLAGAELAERSGPAIHAGPPSGLELDDGSSPEPQAAPAGAASPPRVFTCQLEGFGEHGLSVVSAQGKRKAVAFGEILGVGVGAVPARGADGVPRNVLFTDLVVSWGGEGAGATVLRLSSNALGLSRLYPGVPGLQAYRQWLSQLLEHSGATALGDRDALLRGEFARYDDLGALERACYGAAAAA